MRFILTLFSLLPFFLSGVEPDFYVWQREHGNEVKEAVLNYYRSSTGKLYFLAGELENDGRIYKASPEKYVDLSRAVPVVRVHIKHMKKTPSALAEELVKFYRPWEKTKEFQIDLDAPESKISYYRELMQELRRRLPGVKLSATVLPCHLKHTKEFRALAEACDYYVLQVHGLEGSGFLWHILDRTTSFQALERAKALKLPFKTALPFYCCDAEGEHVEPDMHVVGALAKASPGVIGFRLGVSGDPKTLDLKAALKICRGEKYSPSVAFRWEKQKNGAWHLFVQNNGYYPKYMHFECQWTNIPSSVFMGVFNKASFYNGMKEFRLPLPPSGESRVYLWLRTKSNSPSDDVTFKNNSYEVGNE